MKIFVVFILTTLCITSYAQTQVAIPTPGCDSFEVYKNTVDYLKKQKELPFTEPQILKAALEINKGCNGADLRFQRVFELLSNSGVAIRQSYELAVDFAKMTNQKTDNFIVLFKGLFLENKFDLDFDTAYKTSLELSAALPKDWEKVRNDFKMFMSFCSGSKSEELPIRQCAEWTLSLLKFEDHFPAGIYLSFDNLYNFLITRKGPQLPVKDRLHLVRELLAYGPKAPENFKRSLEWLGSKKGPGLSPTKAHTLALEIAKNSRHSEILTTTEKSLQQ